MIDPASPCKFSLSPLLDCGSLSLLSLFSRTGNRVLATFHFWEKTCPLNATLGLWGYHRARQQQLEPECADLPSRWKFYHDPSPRWCDDAHLSFQLSLSEPIKCSLVAGETLPTMGNLKCCFKGMFILIFWSLFSQASLLTGSETLLSFCLYFFFFLHFHFHRPSRPRCKMNVFSGFPAKLNFDCLMKLASLYIFYI